MFVRSQPLRWTTILTISLLAVLVGLGVARLGGAVSPLVSIVCVLGAAVLGRKRRSLLLLGCILAGLSLGWWRGGAYLPRVQSYQQYYGQRVNLLATATQDAVYAEQGQLSFYVSNIRLQGTGQKLVGELSVRGRGVPMVYRGDQVHIAGRLDTTLGSRQGRMSFAQLRVVGRQRSFLDNVRYRFMAAVQNVLPEPQASFALGLLIGQRSNLPESLSDALTAASLTHIVAVSGYNLTILVRGMQRLRSKKSRYQTVLLGAALMLLFVVLVGPSASIVRAIMVSSLSLLAWYFGRRIKPLLLLSLVAAITALYNPLYLWADIGWYLSFLAFFGVLVVAPLLSSRLGKWGQRPLGGLVSETIAAQVMTVPLILYIFGRTSLYGLLANLLVVPTVPFAMLLSFVSAGVGMVMPLWGGIVALPARLVLSYILEVAQLFSGLPHAVSEQYITPMQMLLLYVMILGVLLLLYLRNRDKHGTIISNKEQEL